MKLTTHQRYLGLNRRFDKRAAQLTRARYKFHVVPVGGTEARFAPTVGVFARGRVAIAASEVMHADRDTWLDVLARSLNRSTTAVN